MTTATTVANLVVAVPAADAFLERHRAEVLEWLSSTTDVFRRVKPSTPSPHLVSYFLLVERSSRRILLCGHRLAGRWLPTGGHVEPGEHPADTVRREAREELGIEAEFDPATGADPFFLTVARTVGTPETSHTDVSLWFALTGHRDQHLVVDEAEFSEVRWWSRDEVAEAARGAHEPHLTRALDALDARRLHSGA